MSVKIGLALGGGAMRGLAHIGVIEVLEQEGIDIAYVAGCSIGAVSYTHLPVMLDGMVT